MVVFEKIALVRLQNSSLARFHRTLLPNLQLAPSVRYRTLFWKNEWAVTKFNFLTKKFSARPCLASSIPRVCHRVAKHTQLCFFDVDLSMLQGLCGLSLNTRCRFTRHFVLGPLWWSVGSCFQNLAILSDHTASSPCYLYSYRSNTATHLLRDTSTVPIHRANWRSLVTSPSLSLFQSSVIGSSPMSTS